MELSSDQRSYQIYMKNSKLYLSFGTGFLIGGIISAFGLKTYMERHVKNNQSKDIQLAYQNKIDELEKELEEARETNVSNSKESVNRLNEIKNSMSIVDYSKKLGYLDNSASVPERYPGISVIKPEEYGDIYSYGEETFTYFADHKLASDKTERIIENVDELIGSDNLKSIGLYEPGVLHIKNDNTKSYYQIFESENTYAELIGDMDPMDEEDLDDDI